MPSAIVHRIFPLVRHTLAVCVCVSMGTLKCFGESLGQGVLELASQRALIASNPSSSTENCLQLTHPCGAKCKQLLLKINTSGGARQAYGRDGIWQTGEEFISCY